MGAVVEAETLSITKGIGGVTRSAIGKSGVTGLPTTPECWAAFRQTASLLPVPQLLPGVPPSLSIPTIYFKA